MSTLTPLLSLVKPDGSDAAQISVINGNMDILDNAVTLAGGQTLTNKTLTSPTMSNPTITSGDLTLSTGSLTITIGNIAVTAGNVTLGAGSLTITAGHLSLAAAASKIIPGATSFAIRNNADGENNLIITNAGAATIRAGLTVTAGGVTITAGGLTVTADGATISAGSLAVSTGTIGVGAAASAVSAILTAGSYSGPNAVGGINVSNPTLTAASNNDTVYGSFIGVTPAAGGFTTLSAYGLQVGFITSVPSAFTTVAGIATSVPAGASGQNHGILVNSGGGTANANYSMRLNPPIGTSAYNVSLYLGTPSGGSTNVVIDSASGATLTTAGVWTNNPSWAALKSGIRDPDQGSVVRWANWLRDSYSPKHYRYAAPDSYTPERDYGHFGFLLDDVPDEIRHIWCANEGGGISTKDTEGFLLAMVQECLRRIEALSA